MENQESKEEEDSASAKRAVCFVSSDFDPLRALHADDLQPPDMTVQPLPNLQACISILPMIMASETLEELHLKEKINISEERVAESSQNPGLINSDYEHVSASGVLNFFSPDFDALKALHTKDLAPPNPRVRPLDNLSSCRRILPEEIPESIINAPPKVPRSAESILAQERAKAHKSTILQKAAERERRIKIFDKIAEKLKNGPVGLLAECYQHKLKVKVWTRHTHGVRGSLTGYLLAFDKHLNLVLRDIDEEYSVRRWIPRLVRKRGRSAHHQAIQENDNNDQDQSLHVVKDISTEVNIRSSSCVHQLADNATGIEEVTDRLKELRLFPKLEHRRRHLKQVFLRGDSVVMVQKLSSMV